MTDMKLKTHQKVGLMLVVVGVTALAISQSVRSIGSVLAIAGIALVLIGCFVVAPSIAF